MTFYARLDNDSIEVIKGIKSVCANGKNDFLEKNYPEIYSFSILYNKKKWRKLKNAIDESNSIYGAYITEIILYMRCLASYNIDFDKNPIEFMQSVNLLPRYMQFYFKALICYSTGQYEESYALLSESKFYLNDFINDRRDYLESSIRGVNSAISFSELDELYIKFPEVPLNCFGYKIPQFIPKNVTAHVIGCDSVYFNKFFIDFLQSFDSVTNFEVDLCVHISNPNDTSLKIVDSLSDRNNIFFSFDYLKFKNIKTYYTETRFILAYYLKDKYSKFVFSDVDLDLKPSYKKLVFSNDYDVCMKKANNPKIPWRGVDAKFLIVSAKDPNKFDTFIGGMVRHFLYTYLPNLNPNGNRQWWIDQYSLAIISDSVKLQRVGYDNIKIEFYNPTEMPVIVAEDLNITRDEFSRRNL